MSTTPEEVTALTAQITDDTLANWSDDKKSEFCKTLDQRIRVTRFLLISTAQDIFALAKQKRFLSTKFDADVKFPETRLLYDNPDRYYQNDSTIGGRAPNDLRKIAMERAHAVIAKLPSLAGAVRTLSPDVAKMIEKRDKLVADGKRIAAEAEDLEGPMDMDSLDQSMALSEFRQMLADREKKRKQLVRKLSDIGEEGVELDDKINKFLYEGLPGLSEAVMSVIQQSIDRSVAFDTFSRRTAEYVKFGDSDAAKEMLASFEKDEAKVSEEVQDKFDEALETLKAAAAKGIGTKRAKRLK